MPLEQVAIAGLALKAAAVFGFVIYSLRLAWEPYSISNLVRHEHDPTFFSRALERYALAMYLILSMVLLSTPWFVRLLAPPSYGEAATVALFMMTAQYWVGMCNMAVIGVHGARQTARLLPIYGWGAVANVAVLLLAARWFGPLVAGFGLLAGAVVSAILTVTISNRIFSTNFSLRLLGFSLLATILPSAVLLALLSYLGPSVTADPAQAALWLGGGSAVLLAGGLVLAVFGIGLERSRGLLLEAIQPLRKVPGA
jgi:O-antigen/teichoic acid export membrane protein